MLNRITSNIKIHAFKLLPLKIGSIYSYLLLKYLTQLYVIFPYEPLDF